MQWSTPGAPGPRPDPRSSAGRFQRSNPGDSRRQLGIHSAEFLVCQQYPHAKIIEPCRQVTYHTTTSWSRGSRKQKPVLVTKPCSKSHFVDLDEIFCLDGCPKERGTRSDRTTSHPKAPLDSITTGPEPLLTVPSSGMYRRLPDPRLT
jgi:hypothetical protein